MRASPRSREGAAIPPQQCYVCSVLQHVSGGGCGAGMPRGTCPSSRGLELGVSHLSLKQGAYIQPVLPVRRSDLASEDPQGELFSWSWYLWPSPPLDLSALPLAFIFATCDCHKWGLSGSCWWEAALFEM